MHMYIMFLLGSVCRSNPPQSHCALPLLLPVNQSEPSVFVMVEDNQFQNKEKNGRDKTGLEEKMRKDEGKRLSVVLIGDHCPI